jgi:hypothetical protein
MPLFIKEPYTSGTERHVRELRDLIRREFPELAEGQFVLPTQEQA